MTDPSLYRDDSRVRHMLDAMERIVEMCKGLDRAQLRKHENVTEIILFNMMVLGEAANNITREFAAKNPDVDWKGLSGVRHKIVHDYADIAKMDYLVSWNFRHITNAQMIPKIKKVCLENGYVCAEICTPQMLQEEVQDDV
jgi:uncharacterized protein with HEPN domain